MQKVLAGQEWGHPPLWERIPRNLPCYLDSQVLLCGYCCGPLERPCSPSQPWSPWGPVGPGCFLFSPFLARLLDQLPLWEFVPRDIASS